jgi:hypothetical protein
VGYIWLNILFEWNINRYSHNFIGFHFVGI